ncbi:sensor histidine kinase [Salinarimonas soli]|uniref:histidine kinase n=1 Tax=Salinarimonas soli TaxID=1638099 RepID=A0A5B2VEX2_9HYPH|nr:HAMP domain-containing sensor histidine kinase [Salinarimonas soli]KAA2237494.1 HAMP domain-containing histidine kinase [Salinarimonas soli]
MQTLKARFALLVGGAALVVVLAAGALLAALHASEVALERSLAAQARLDLLTELSGRLSDYGLASIDAVNAPALGRGRIAAARAEVERALQTVDERIGREAAGAATPLERNEMATRSRPVARLRAALSLLDRQVDAALQREESAARTDAVRGALNGFGAITGPALSFLVEAERRAVDAASAEARALTNRLRLGAVAAALAAFGALLVLHRAATRPVLRHLDAIREAASAIGRGELETRLPRQGRDELGLLVAGFNRMAGRLSRRERRVAADRAALEETIAARTADLRAANARLEDIDQARRRFFTDVSHELRTPLTVILGECDIALRTLPPGDTALRAGLLAIRKRAQGLHRRVEDMLRVARSEAGQLELDLRPVSLLPILSEAVEGFASLARSRGVALAFEPAPADVEVRGDPEWLRQIVEGLIDNALRHAAGATRINVALATLGSTARISVTDDGAGFPAEGAALFERFARAGGYGPAGFGIGLALARWVTERHEGAVGLETGPDGRGARVVLDLPMEGRERAA